MADKQERRSVKRIDCFDHSILNAEIQHSLVIDITNEGAGLLVLKEHTLFNDNKTQKCDLISGNVHLTIFHPNIPLEEGASIDAKVIWLDHEYSEDHCKIGVSFFDLDKAQADYVGKLAEWLSKENHYFFHCELEKR